MQRSTPLRALFLSLVLLFAAGLAVAAPLTFDPNRQYFLYNGKTIALVGASAEYLCHIDQPTGNDTHVCTWNNNPQYFANIAGKGVNKIRMWVGLNHSPGTHNGFGL